MRQQVDEAWKADKAWEGVYKKGKVFSLNSDPIEKASQTIQERFKDWKPHTAEAIYKDKISKKKEITGIEFGVISIEKFVREITEKPLIIKGNGSELWGSVKDTWEDQNAALALGFHSGLACRLERQLHMACSRFFQAQMLLSACINELMVNTAKARGGKEEANKLVLEETAGTLLSAKSLISHAYRRYLAYSLSIVVLGYPEGATYLKRLADSLEATLADVYTHAMDYLKAINPNDDRIEKISKAWIGKNLPPKKRLKTIRPLGLYPSNQSIQQAINYLEIIDIQLIDPEQINNILKGEGFVQ